MTSSDQVLRRYTHGRVEIVDSRVNNRDRGTLAQDPFFVQLIHAGHIMDLIVHGIRNLTIICYGKTRIQPEPPRWPSSSHGAMCSKCPEGTVIILYFYTCSKEKIVRIEKLKDFVIVGILK